MSEHTLDTTSNSSSGILSEYGQFVALLDADVGVLREALRDCNEDQLRTVINCLQDQINDTPIEGNEELFKHHLYLLMFAIRQLEGRYEHGKESDNFQLNFLEWLE